MIASETVTIYATTANSYGDDIRGTSYEVAAVVEGTVGWRHAQYADMDVSVQSVWIDPAEQVYQDHGLEMVGMIAKYGGITYRIVGLNPGKSLINGDEDLVMLTLTRLEAADGQ